MSYSHVLKKEWDERHADIGSKVNYVTSTNFSSLNAYHQLDLKNVKTILDIGIGTGEAVKELKNTYPQLKIYASDVSRTALELSKEWWDISELSTNLKNLKAVDLAYAHLVMQHNTDEEVTRIINDVNLKDQGIFSVQFAALNPSKTIELSHLIMTDINKGMLFFRSLDRFKQLVKRTNKKLVEIRGSKWFSSPYNFEWHVVRLMNK